MKIGFLRTLSILQFPGFEHRRAVFTRFLRVSNAKRFTNSLIAGDRLLFDMKKALCLLFLFLFSLATPILVTSAEETGQEMEVLHTAINPQNNNTYHLLSASSWTDAASFAQSLGGFLVTVDDSDENNWVFETFGTWENQSRHLWIGLNDASDEGQFKWHDGTPFFYRSWGDAQPSEGGDEDYVHIAGTNMGNIDPGTWNDLENDPQYFPVYGVVEIGPGADYALRFDGESDHVVVPDDTGLDTSNDSSVVISAWVHPFSVQGNQFIIMKGDYGWGLYLSNDRVAFASEYSLARHPTSNTTVQANVWTLVGVEVTRGVGYAFSINGEEAGTVLDEDADIPLGDFGSNDCFEQGLACDELYIGRMGAGCDCAHFEGLLDNITVLAGNNLSNLEERTTWMFGEGEGATTHDNVADRTGTIHGADWVMPDGSIVAQAVELEMGQEHLIEGASEGDTLLFFSEVETYTRTLSWFSSSWMFDDWNDNMDSMFTVYVGFNQVPDRWVNNGSFSDDFGFAYQEWSWPDEGTVWFVMVVESSFSELYISLEADVADPPPTLDDMTELKESIAVTNQEVGANFDSGQGYGALYYYVNVTEPLADLRIRTYGGRGNVDLGISYYSPPSPDDFWFFEDGDFGISVEGEAEKSTSKSEWSTGPGNDEEVHLYDVQPGIYYITAYTYRNARGFTILADFIYPPTNVEPADAITLTPGIAYGLLSGYDGLMQYFKVEVPQDTERLVVDLTDGGGEASLYLRHEQAPTVSTYDHHTTTAGVGDRVAFNDPTPGWWYILLTTDSAFSGVNILAEFADRYVWEYNGVPIELFNGEAVEGVAVGKQGTVSFFAMLDRPGNFFQVETYGGVGDAQLLVEGTQYEFDFGDWGRPMQDGGIETTTNEVTLKSSDEGTQHIVQFEAPMNGRINIQLIGISDVEEISIVARWDASEFPIEPVEPTEPTSVETCAESAENMFKKLDRNLDGLLSGDERQSIDASQSNRLGMDLNDDDAIEYREYLQFKCTCDVELQAVFDGFSEGRDAVSLSSLEAHVWANDYEMDLYDANQDTFLDRDELELLILMCETTFDAFDGDGDGVPDEDDAFPDDPTETKDTDGDGVGDNADIVASVSNDIVYATAGTLVVVLVGLLVLFLRSGSRGEVALDKDWGDEARFDDVLSSPTPSFDSSVSGESALGIPPLLDEIDPPHQDATELVSSTAHEPPNRELMGMMLGGVETVEHPTGSGNFWIRHDPESEWEFKSR